MKSAESVCCGALWKHGLQQVNSEYNNAGLEYVGEDLTSYYYYYDQDAGEGSQGILFQWPIMTISRVLIHNLWITSQ